MNIKGNAIVLDLDNVSTDQIFPGQYINLIDPAEIALHVLEGVHHNMREKIKPGTVLIVGKNFGCGSSREQAVITLKESGVCAVVAGSAGRIWYRNAINLALPVIICPEPVKHVRDGEAVEIRLNDGTVCNISTGAEYQGEPVPEFILDIFAHGGIKPMMREKTEL